MLEKGLVQIYTGDGKGKTTAALGLALRAAGAGNKVLIYQFLKPANLRTGERTPLYGTKITLRVMDVPWDMTKGAKDPKQATDAKKGIREILAKIADTAAKRIYDMIILDEIVFCLSQHLAKLEDIKNVIEKRDERVEIVLTGRGATEELMELADLVTEMKNIKHPFDKGVKARKGIEF
jgi:cob(I)alamin adenosyltransferase